MKRTRLALVVTLLALAAPGLNHAADAKPRPGSDIIGGGPAAPGEFPFVAAILNERYGGNDWNKQFCGGSLIAADWVLTAAHCVEGTATKDLAVAVGRTSLSDSAQGQRRSVSAVFVHPDYGDPTGNAHDAALLRLSSPTTGIAPITLSGPNDEALEATGQWLTVIGWGTIRTGKPVYPEQLQKVDVPVVSDATCKGAYGGSLDPATEVCAGAAGIDSCYGDSGGPLFANGSSKIQVGIVSWGTGCAKKRFPGVYAEVNNSQADNRGIRDFIRTTTGV